MTATDPSTKDPLDEWRNARTSLRTDLKISRQLIRGEPFYVVFDPVRFQAHQFSLQDYQVAVRLTKSKTLKNCFERAVNDGQLNEEDEPGFFRFVAQLDSLGLLGQSRQGSAKLFERYETKTRSAHRARWMSVLFATIPLSNPDRFLDRTLRWVSFLFSRAALLLWAIALATAGWLLLGRLDEFFQPINGVLAVQNIPFVVMAFLLLKIWHELGHGYACKRFGGTVPEIGCKLIVGMPLAYVDATSAWSFPQKRQRVMVMLAGMYFETLVAIPAAILWVTNPDSVLGSYCYQLVLMAGLTTVLFNANPLMKYDGYFILCDLLGLRNLRAKSSLRLKQLAKHWLFAHAPPPEISRSDAAIHYVYGIAARIYAVVVMSSIAAAVAFKAGVVGLLTTVVVSCVILVRKGTTLVRYLLSSPRQRIAVVGRGRLPSDWQSVFPSFFWHFPFQHGCVWTE